MIGLFCCLIISKIPKEDIEKGTKILAKVIRKNLKTVDWKPFSKNTH